MTVPLPVLGFHMNFAGVDPHSALLPPPVPSLTADAFTGLLTTWSSGSRNAPTVSTPGGDALGRGHEIGMLSLALHIPIVAFDPLYMLVFVAASGKSPFGVSSVRIATVNGVQPIAVSSFGPLGLQQQCGDVAPMLSFQCGAGLVVGAFNSTVQAGMTGADVAGALAQMYADSCYAAVTGYIFGKIAGAVHSFFGGALQAIEKMLFENMVSITLQWGFGFVPTIESDGPFELGHALSKKITGSLWP